MPTAVFRTTNPCKEHTISIPQFILNIFARSSTTKIEGNLLRI